MPKRKRKGTSVPLAFASQSEKTSKSTENPFLADADADRVTSSSIIDGALQRNLLDWLITVDDRAMGPGRTSIEGDDDEELDAAFDGLLNYLSLETDTTINRIHSDDVAMRLLPWAIKRILSTANDASETTKDPLPFRALDVCLSTITRRRDSNHDSSAINPEHSRKALVQQTILSQSTMFKLVPLLALFVCRESSGVTSANVHTHATHAFEILVRQDFFRPTLDVACRSLLIPVADAMNLSEMPLLSLQDGSFDARARVVRKLEGDDCHEARQTRILRAVITLIHSLHFSRKGNPKTAFQLFASSPVLLALSRSYFYFALENITKIQSLNDIYFEQSSETCSLIRIMLDDGLFSPVHHMDGFRSLLATITVTEGLAYKSKGGDGTPEKQAQFHCYQEDLFFSLESTLTDATVDVSKAPNTRDIACIVPLLFSSFVENFAEMDSRSPLRRVNSKKETQNDIRFRLFAYLMALLRNVVRVNEDTLPTPMTAFGLNSMVECVKVVLQHNIYLPTMESAGSSGQYSTLEGIFMDITGVGNSDNSFFGVQTLSCCLSAIENLVKLDHRLVHNHLDMVLQLSLGSKKVLDVALSLLVALAETYGKLRQQGHLFRALLNLGRDNSVSDDELKTLRSILRNENSLQQALARIIQSSPIRQTEDIFEGLGDTLSSCNDPVAYLRLDVAVQISILLARNVTVSSGSSLQVSRFVSTIVKGPVTKLLDHQSGFDDSTVLSLKKAALTICGWFVAVVERCIFWNGDRIGELELPAPVIKIIEAPPDEVVDVVCSDLADELLFLLCHRLRRVHSSLIDGDKIDLATQHGSGTCFHEDPVRLASVIGLIARRKSRWVLVSQNLRVWIIYATHEHVDWFLNWFFSMLAIDVTKLELPSESIAWRDVFSGTEEELQCVKALLRDSSFFEHPKVSAKYCLAAMLCTSQWLTWTLSDTELSTKPAVTKLKNVLLDNIGSINDRRSSVDFVCRFLSGHSKLGRMPVAARKKLSKQFLQASVPIMVANGWFTGSHSKDRALEVIMVATRCDYVCRVVASGGIDSVVRLASCLRKTISMELTLFTGSFFGPNELSGMLSGFLTSALHFCADSQNLCPSLESLIESTGAVVIQLVRISLLDPACHVTLEETFRSLLEPTSNIGIGRKHDQKACSRLARFFLVGILSAPSSYRKSCSTSSLQNICGEALDFVGRSIRQLDREDSNSVVPAAVLVMAGDALRLASEYEIEASAVESDLVDWCSEQMGCDDRELRHAIHYFLACFTKDLQDSKLASHIFSKISRLPYQDPLLLASCCRLVSSLDERALRASFLELLHVPSDLEKQNSSSRTRILRILLQNIPGGKHQSVVEEIGPSVLSFSLSQLKVAESGVSTIESCLLLNELVNRRDIVVLTERSLARILSYLCTAVGSGSKLTTMPSLAQGVFDNVVNVFITIFQRYTKQLFACISSVIATVNALNCRVLYDSNLSDEEVSQRGQLLARLCELLIPHNDIYKKHMLGPLLEFIHCLSCGMPVARREALLPSVYCMLDCLSEHEMSQLNSLMDTKSKILFRSVHESYQKVHSYKGR